MINAPYVSRHGRTNQVAGTQGLILNAPNLEYAGGFGLSTNQHGYVEIPGDGPYDFGAFGGNGTIEAVVSLEPSALTVLSSELLCWFSSCTTPGVTDYYQFMADYNGYIYYQNQVTGSGAGQLIRAVPGGLVGKRTHIAVVFQNATNVTCYANGVSLGTKKQAGFGNSPPNVRSSRSR